jgi:hypothetical protein
VTDTAEAAEKIEREMRCSLLIASDSLLAVISFNGVGAEARVVQLDGHSLSSFAKFHVASLIE